jgi:ABC-type Na+ efflux pump permease subunit
MIIAAFDPKPTTLLKILGSAILFLASIHLLIGFINLSNQDPLIHLIGRNFRVNPNYYFYFMPFLFLIGLLYIILGIRLPKIKSGILASHIVISVFLIIWTVCWIFFKNQGQETSTDPIAIITYLIIILIPQIIIGDKLFRLEKGRNTT